MIKFPSIIFFIGSLAIFGLLTAQGAAAVPCVNIPLGGSYTVTTTCAFTDTIDGVEIGNLTINAGQTLTINAGQTIVWNPGSSVVINGAIILNKSSPGTQIRKTYIVYPDAASRGYPDSVTQYATSSPASGYRRRSDSAFTQKWTYTRQVTTSGTLDCKVATSCSGGDVSLLKMVRGASTLLLNTWNISALTQSATRSGDWTLTVPSVPYTLYTYHWNNGSGSAQANMYIKRSSDNAIVWQGMSVAGTATEHYAYPTSTLPVGTYYVTNDAAAWSYNAESGGSASGFLRVYIYPATNAHAELPSQSNYNLNVCCSAGGTTVGTTCSGKYDTFLKLSGTSNAQVEKGTNSNYANSACLSSTYGSSVSCAYPTGACSAGYACLGSISGDTNAHIGSCDAYSTNICCTVVQ